MNTPFAILAGGVLVSGAVLLDEAPPAAQAESLEAIYTVERSDAGVWRLNTHTGQVSHCSFELNKENELIVKCLAWAD